MEETIISIVIASSVELRQEAQENLCLAAGLLG